MNHVHHTRLSTNGMAMLLILIFWSSALGNRGMAQTVEQPQTVLPEVRVTNVRRVFHNGEHNAFTDLIRFQNRYFLAFRSCPDGHMVHPTASIIVLASQDLKRWEKVNQFSVPMRDTRDPHFLEFSLHVLLDSAMLPLCGDEPGHGLSLPKSTLLKQVQLLAS